MGYQKEEAHGRTWTHSFGSYASGWKALYLGLLANGLCRTESNRAENESSIISNQEVETIRGMQDQCYRVGSKLYERKYETVLVEIPDCS